MLDHLVQGLLVLAHLLQRIPRRAALEEAARGHLADIAHHAGDAGAAAWVAVEPPAADPVVTSSEPASGSAPVVSAPSTAPTA